MSEEKGVRVRRKRVARGSRMGMNTRSKVGGKTLVEDKLGRIALKTSSHHSAKYYSKADIWAHAYLGAPLFTMKEKPV